VRELLDALRAYHADESPHSGRSLLDHLVGTAERLRAWGNPEHVVRAGLFHSVYGTQSYRIVSVPLERRAEIVALIGVEAERLAFLFSVCERRRFVEDVAIGHATGVAYEVTVADIDQLLEIEVANLLDQVPAPILRVAEHLARIQDRVSPGARAAIRAWNV
jgi:hypothetical protein